MSAPISVVGYRAGLAAFASTVAFVVVQTLQLAGVLGFPLDEILIYGTSLAIVLPFLLMMLALHHLTVGEARYWSHAALILTVVYAVFVTANYVVQLATVIPAKLRGPIDALRVLDQTPQSMFWDYDAVGYICMGLAALLALPALGRSGIERHARMALVAHALVTPLIATVYFYPGFSPALLMLGVPWAVTAPLFMFMLALVLRDRGRRPAG